MIEEVYKNIYRIGVALPGDPLKELNSYFIRGTDSDLPIDTGFRRDICRQCLESGLRELGSDPERLGVLVTHLHSDHSGMADLFAGRGRTIYMSDVDLYVFEQFRLKELPGYRDRRFISEGFTEGMLAEVFATNPAMIERMERIDERTKGIQDGYQIQVGDYTLETLLVPGHTPGNCMFHIRDEEVMFTGDHLLFDITPNITYWPQAPDSLGDHINSLYRVRDLPVKLALPGHRHPGRYRERIDALLSHHEKRLSEALSIIEQHPGLNAVEIAGQMKWKIRADSWETFPVVQKWSAVGECLAHLDYHLERENIRCETVNGIRRYYKASDPDAFDHIADTTG